MKSNKLFDIIQKREAAVSLENIFDNSRADSGGERDLNFLKYLVNNKLLIQTEAVLKRTIRYFDEEYFKENYRKSNYESDRHFMCRALIQEELKKLDIKTTSGIDIGNMEILRSNSNYDIVTDDFSTIIDIGLTPARNYFKGISDLRVVNYLITTYFDDYMDEIIFAVFSRANDQNYLAALRDYEEGFRIYTPNPQLQADERMYYNNPDI